MREGDKHWLGEGGGGYYFVDVRHFYQSTAPAFQGGPLLKSK